MTPAQQEACRQAEVMIAFSEGKEIEIANVGSSNWKPIETPMWAWNSNDYRIAAPKPKKVKFLCWYDGDRLLHLAEHVVVEDWKRIPELDKEVEVVEP